MMEGITSDTFEISNTVFQGTVLGPPLWNTFFSDVALTVDACPGSAEPSLFADDLSIFQKFDRLENDEAVLSTVRRNRERVHKWGRVNRVIFDPSKEHEVILHPIFGSGEPFKLLGCLIDCKLIMNQAIDKILAQIRPKVAAILRTRRYYNTAELIDQF